MIGRLWVWANATDPRTWATHAVIALTVAGITSLAVGLRSGAVFAFGFYLLREIEQVATFSAKGQQLHPLDHVMDVAAPGFAVLPLVLL